MSEMKNLTGCRFGRLTVLSRFGSTAAGQARWLARCECGNEVRAPGSDLRLGKTTSCGCARVERLRKLNASHGQSLPTPEYTAWANMKSRCRPEFKERHLYFDRGIRVCREWSDSFEAFLAHIGPKPSPELSLDRIDNDRGYEPGNVRWATASEQRSNQRRVMEAA